MRVPLETDLAVWYVNVATYFKVVTNALLIEGGDYLLQLVNYIISIRCAPVV